jgi:hypothetical protein
LLQKFLRQDLKKPNETTSMSNQKPSKKVCLEKVRSADHDVANKPHRIPVSQWL